MKNMLSAGVYRSNLSRFAVGAVVIGSLLALSPAAHAQAITDDFTDGNDTANPIWTHLSGLVNSTGQSWTVSGGTYRLQAPNNGFNGFSFVGSYTGPAMSDQRVESDFVLFPGPGAANAPAFGVGARLSGNNAFNALTGYAYGYEPFAAGGLGEMVLYRMTGASLTDIGSQQVSLDPSRDYRFVLEISGSSLHGQVFEIGGGMVAERFATDATYSTGFGGVFGYSQNPLPATDFTVDNFSVVPEPGVTVLLGVGLIGFVAGRRLLKRA